MRNPFEYAIVAGVDGSESGVATVDVAAAEAFLRGLPLALLSAHPARNGSGPHISLTALLRRVCTNWPTLPATAHNVTGTPAEQLIDASRTASLVVVGQDRVPSGSGRLTTGSTPLHPVAADVAPVVSQVAAHSHCPTMMVPPDAAATITGPVLLGLGMTIDDEPAIAFAFEEAAVRRVPLLVVHVWSGIPAAAVGTVSPFAYDLHRAQSAADAMLAGELASWAGKYPEVEVDRMPLYDVNPAQTLLEATELASLVVVGAHRRSLGGSQLVGSVTRTLLARATRPVVVVRGDQHLR